MTPSEATAPRRPVRIGNGSGFYGDRIDAAREVVAGGGQSTCSPVIAWPS